MQDQFDIAFISYGTMGLLSDVGRWAHVVAECITNGGTIVFARFHPAVGMSHDDFTHVPRAYNYHAPILEAKRGTHTDTDAGIYLPSIGRNHPPANVGKTC